jgi:hypothetical protein
MPRKHRIVLVGMPLKSACPSAPNRAELPNFSRRVTGGRAQENSMYDHPQFGVIVVVALYAIAGVLALIGGVVAVRVRRRHKQDH